MDEKNSQGDDFQRKVISELHDIALSLKAMSGRNIVLTGEERKEKTYVERYFERSEVRDDCKP